MTFALQGSLLDQVDEVGLRPLAGAVQRTVLTRGAWLDLRPGWLTGADELFSRLTLGGPAGVEWHGERRVMWDKEIETPRLLRFYDEGERLPDPVLTQARVALSDYYRDELGEPFRTAGMCLYRDGRDSVAWHGDREGRASTQDTMVAIVSIGSPRALHLRPAGGGESVRQVLGHGDLIVMGGSCQRTWEHAIPKTARPVGPRISIQFRPRGVR
ncbi:alpha-ketoglutarate-dependent dioxygenase AlkB [Calidifontibacter sp. DB0510]|uniref:Alpha-ketoglutarate-dependent dioxygenase AlkB n=1 Tax=Metallococcus carri TaxID=1656884 RepID=A0A967AWD0_9MICO|nr:alpha-ketoglutarate-dependent dioxygenase AlkB [Metallococcus carri]NHN54171.1 alpha-ketoglutarate-dependent dioxygenase AlkB [Metallococcus carri]NOP36989.1 alpha-ketoglutarate-dependent dioxygenase AlkB [Calidifontibacter sp. DB2511S]